MARARRHCWPSTPCCSPSAPSIGGSARPCWSRSSAGASRARELGMPVPVNRRVQDYVGAIWRREERPGLALLRRLYEESRTEVYAATAGGYRAAPPDQRAAL